MAKNKRVHRIFVSATKQNDGKTAVSMGLCYALQSKFKNIGFIKPVGQRYVVDSGEKVDEDSVLIESILGLECPIKDMSPVAVDRGFTKKYILHGNKDILARKIKTSFRTVAKDKDLVIIEGTGHAGVGAVFDLSNAKVAKMLDSKVIIVSSGGIGRPIDEIVLNKALYEQLGVPIAGVIVNKVRPDKYDKINKIVRLGLQKKGLKVLGVIPYNPLLSEPSMAQLLEELGYKLLTPDASLDIKIDKILVGAMAPHNALNYISNRSLVITPGDREDVILAVVGFQMDKAKDGISLAGIVLTGGIKPHSTIIDLVKRANIPLLLAAGDTYTVASAVHDLTVKIKPEDREKTKIVKSMIEKYVDIDKLVKEL